MLLSFGFVRPGETESGSGILTGVTTAPRVLGLHSAGDNRIRAYILASSFRVGICPQHPIFVPNLSNAQLRFGQPHRRMPHQSVSIPSAVIGETPTSRVPFRYLRAIVARQMGHMPIAVTFARKSIDSLRRTSPGSFSISVTTQVGREAVRLSRIVALADEGLSASLRFQIEIQRF
jgi:hypothetical protein